MALIKCYECNKEISDKALSCPSCGCPIEKNNVIKNEIESNIKDTPNPHSKDSYNSDFINEDNQNKSLLTYIPIIISIVLLISTFFIFYIEIVYPQKKIEKSKDTYKEAITLLECGNYSEAHKLLNTICDYEDVKTILNQIVFESYAYSCINDLKQNLKNPDSFILYDIYFYENYDYTNNTVGEYPICIISYGAQNGFGGISTGYAYCVNENSEDTYKVMGTCNSLDENDYTREDEIDELLVCMLINTISENNKKVGDFDIDRIHTVIDNKAESDIDIIKDNTTK